MTLATPTSLPLDAREVARTLEPVERATMLPPAAFADPAVFDVGARAHLSRLGLRRPRLRGRRAGQVRHPRARHRQRRRDRRRGRPAARVPQRLPPSRRADRRGDRGQGAQAPALSLPRLVLRARRLAEGGAPHGRGRGLRLLLLGPDPGAARGRRRPGPDRPLRRGAGRRRARRRAARPPRALPAGGARPRPRRSTTRSTRTGRGSPRTTTSACTARASTPSSTRSATT